MKRLRLYIRQVLQENYSPVVGVFSGIGIIEDSSCVDEVSGADIIPEFDVSSEGTTGTVEEESIDVDVGVSDAGESGMSNSPVAVGVSILFVLDGGVTCHEVD